MKLYGLFHDRKNAILKISPFTMGKNVDGLGNDGVVLWNKNYYISSSRKALRDKAKLILNDWIIETQLRVDSLKDLKVIHKY